MTAFLQLFCLILLFSRNSEGTSEQPEISVFTVATQKTHGLERFLRSVQVYNINVEVLGMDQKWVGGNMEHPGGGQKINLLKKKLKSLKKLEDRDRIILFTDSYDVMFLAGLQEIVETFLNTYARVLFSAEPFCWPDPTLASEYPDTTITPAFLNSGGFIGYYADIMKILNFEKVRDEDDDQLFYTKVYLEKEYRIKYRIRLDHTSEIFQNLNGALSDVELVTNTSEGEFPYLKNVVSNTRPLIVHGNGPSKLILNQFSNYLAKAWSAHEGCAMCDEKRTPLKEDSLPNVLMAVFIEQPTPFLEEFLTQIQSIDYPKRKIHLFLHNNVEYHELEVDKFYKANFKDYLSAKRIKPTDFLSEAESRNIAKDRCAGSACDYVFSIDSLSRVQPSTLRYLLSTGYDVIAPLLVRGGQAWSNFWGAINSSGFYARSTDYMDIVSRNIK
ncbi:unnamed protein product, partial [Brenthis ino]